MDDEHMRPFLQGLQETSPLLQAGLKMLVAVTYVYLFVYGFLESEYLFNRNQHIRELRSDLLNKSYDATGLEKLDLENKLWQLNDATITPSAMAKGMNFRSWVHYMLHPEED